ncbi:MAG TPA: ATP phosphoribosyltransferase regulatory subunit, partial [Pyrinomonadaceae bacterium]|nr:ATP phosphoribosyltransferase regulatory subunit [Pyrinomonadaceae bacterium]
ASVSRRQPRSHAEWRRESKHAGCELVGAGGHAADLEALLIAAEVLERLNLPRGACRVTLNHVEVFNGVAERLALDADAREQLRQLVDRRDDAGLRDFLAARPAGTSSGAAFEPRLTRLVGGREILDEARGRIRNARSSAAFDALEKLWRAIETLGLADLFELDLGDVSGLDYYTGLVFKIYVEGAGARVGSGGRYDELTANFGRREPAVGFVFDLDALTDLLSRRGDRTSAAVAAAAPVAEVNGANADELFAEARRRRAAGERVRVKAQ